MAHECRAAATAIEEATRWQVETILQILRWNRKNSQFTAEITTQLSCK